MKLMIILTAAFVFLTSSVSAHNGKTDANGGHYDNETGEYHYHHGYPAHEHINGICPYNYDDQTNHSSGTSYSDATPKPELHLETPDPHPAVIVTATPVPEENKMSEKLPLILIISSITIIIIIFVISNAISNLISKKKGYEKLSENLKKEYADLESELKKKYEILEKTYMKQQEKKLAQDKKLLEDILQDKKISCPTMAKVFADYEFMITLRASQNLANKKHPAKKAADRVRYYASRNKELQQKLKEAEYLISYYESMYPQIKENKQISIDDITN